jgi:[ribosomal protein S18]-alanine N-acetyltransferase
MAGIVTATIRDMTSVDLPAVVALEQAVYPQPWSEALFADELVQPNRSYVVAETDGVIVGYAGMLIVDHDAHVTTIAVEPSGRRQRLGSRLMLTLLDRALAAGARHMTLEVRMSNVDAQRLYERFNFTAVGKRKNYYRDEDALVMWATGIDGDDYARRIAALRAELESPS